jgi:excisionase family DNA binding protein
VATPNRQPRLLDVCEVAEYLGVTERWVRRSLHERRFPYHKCGSLVRVAESDLVAYLAANRREAAATSAERPRSPRSARR